MGNLTVYNVKDYGAVGDGVTVDSTDIQAAVNAALGAVPQGGIVYFPPGTYVMSGITFGPGLTVQGAGRQGIGAPFTVTVTASNATLKVNSASAALYPVGELVTLTSGTAPTGLANGNYYVVSSSFAGGVFSFQLSATSGGAAITPTTTGSAVVIQAAAAGGTTLLLDPAAASGAVVCRIAPSSTSIVTSGFTMRDLTIDGNKGAWSAAGSQKGFGFYCGQTTAGLTSNVTIENVTAQNNLTYGFDIEQATNVTLINCVAANNGYNAGTNHNADGFTILSSDVTAIGCQSYGNQVRGFLLGQASITDTRIELVGCEAWSNGSHGVQMGSATGFYLSGSKISGGRFFSNSGAGIEMSTDCVTSSVTGAYCYNNASNGILLNGATYNTITGNTTKDNATGGSTPEIYLENASTNNAITGNSCSTANCANAIVEQSAGGTTDYNTITGNVVTSTGGSSATIQVSGSNTYCNNNQGFTGGDSGPGKTFSGSIILSPAARITGVSNGVLTNDAAALDQLPAVWGAVDQGLLAWNYDPAITNGSTAALATAGTLYVMAVKFSGGFVTNIVLDLTAAGSGLTASQCYAGIWQGAGGSKIGLTADQSTNWAGATGVLTMPLSGGPFSVNAGVAYVGVWFRGTTGPSFWRTASNNIVNAGLAAASSRWGTANTGLTTSGTAPATLGTISAANTAIWVGLS